MVRCDCLNMIKFKDFLVACVAPIGWILVAASLVLALLLISFLWVGPAVIAWMLFDAGYSWWWVVAIAQLPAWGISSIYASIYAEFLEDYLGW